MLEFIALCLSWTHKYLLKPSTCLRLRTIKSSLLKQALGVVADVSPPGPQSLGFGTEMAKGMFVVQGPGEVGLSGTGPRWWEVSTLAVLMSHVLLPQSL